MSKKYGGYEFEAPFTHKGMLDNSSGVYAIVEDNEHSRVIEVEISYEIKKRFLGHGRKNQWENTQSIKLVLFGTVLNRFDQTSRIQFVNPIIRGAENPNKKGGFAISNSFGADFTSIHFA